MYCKDRQRYDSSRYQRKRMPEIKEKLSKLITKYKENIIVISPKRTVKEKVDSFEELMKEYAESKDVTMKKISALSEEKKEEFIKYLLQCTLNK